MGWLCSGCGRALAAFIVEQAHGRHMRCPEPCCSNKRLWPLPMQCTASAGRTASPGTPSKQPRSSGGCSAWYLGGVGWRSFRPERELLHMLFLAANVPLQSVI